MESSLSNTQLKELLLKRGVSDKDIKGSGKNGNVLKSDREKHYKKIQKSTQTKSKLITVKDKQYTEDMLYEMIQYYESRFNIKQPYINNDALYTLLLNTDINEIKNTCSINRLNSSICSQKQFWELKFNHDNIPFITNKDFTNVNDWVKEYIKI